MVFLKKIINKFKSLLIILTFTVSLIFVFSCRTTFYNQDDLTETGNYSDYSLSTISDQYYLFGIQRTNFNPQLFEFLVCLSSSAYEDKSGNRCVNAFRTKNQKPFYIPAYYVENSSIDSSILTKHYAVGMTKTVVTGVMAAHVGFTGIESVYRRTKHIFRNVKPMRIIGMAAVVLAGGLLFIPKEKVDQFTKNIDPGEFAESMVQQTTQSYSMFKERTRQFVQRVDNPLAVDKNDNQKRHTFNIWGTSQLAASEYWDHIMDSSYSEVNAVDVYAPIPTMLPRVAQILKESKWAESSTLYYHCLPFIPKSNPNTVHQGCKKLGDHWDIGNAFFYVPEEISPR